MSEIAKHWIDGEWTGSGTVSESVNPATGAVLGRWADGGEAEARAAVAAARRAFYRPALLEVEDVDTEIVQKEVFGPVATFEVFDTEADAIARANATEYGLAAGIFTSNINISRRVSCEIRAGTVWTNTWAAINDGFAEGGYKQSGIGRLRGPLAIKEFQEAKPVVRAIPPFQV
jgi:acyl-CoA reductase-like NAD-dependent aldehyde dehydrogenase